MKKNDYNKLNKFDARRGGVERYKFFTLIFCVLLAFSVVTFMSCGGDEEESYPQSLTNAVYGGLNPMDAWVTVTFQDSNKVVCAFSGDNTTVEYDFTYDSGKGKGSIVSESWAPGDFELNSSGSVLTFTNFGGHGVSEKFNRLRKTDLSAEPSPSNLGIIENDYLVGTVWGGSTPASSGTAFLTITFQSDSKVICSFSYDNSTNEWTYTYNSQSGGNISTDTGWKITPNGFTISGNTLTIPNFGSMNMGDFSFNRYL